MGEERKVHGQVGNWLDEDTEPKWAVWAGADRHPWLIVTTIPNGFDTRQIVQDLCKRERSERTLLIW